MVNGTSVMVSSLMRGSGHRNHISMGAVGERPRPGQQASAVHTVLVVEDEVLVRLMIADVIRSAGYEVIEAANADEALEVLAHTHGVSLIISDIRTPGSLDGLRLAQLVRSHRPAVPIVLTSGHLRNVDSVDHDGFFPKPYDARKIVEHIEALLARKR